MITRIHLLLLTIILTACAAPATSTQIATEPALPPPAAEISMAASATVLPKTTRVVTEDATQPAEATTVTEPPIMSAPQSFVKMEVGVTGAAIVEPVTGVITFSDDFNISTGPDLFVILSSASNLALDYAAFSETVSAAPILFLGELTNTTGTQAYTIPAGTDLSQYNSVIVWCRQYSVAFAAAPLR